MVPTFPSSQPKKFPAKDLDQQLLMNAEVLRKWHKIKEPHPTSQ